MNNNQRNNASRDENLQMGIQITRSLLQKFESGTWGKSFEPLVQPLFGNLATVLDDQALIGMSGAVLDFLQTELVNHRKKREEVIAENKNPESSEKVEKIFNFVMDKSIMALLSGGKILHAQEYIIPEEHRGRCGLSKYAAEAAELAFFAQTVLVSIQIIMRQDGLNVKEAFARFNKTINFLEQSVEPRLKNDLGWLFITQLVAQLESGFKHQSIFGYWPGYAEMIALIQKNQKNWLRFTPHDGEDEDQRALFVHCLGQIVDYSDKLFGVTKPSQPQVRAVAESGGRGGAFDIPLRAFDFSEELSEEEKQFARELIAAFSGAFSQHKR